MQSFAVLHLSHGANAEPRNAQRGHAMPMQNLTTLSPTYTARHLACHSRCHADLRQDRAKHNLAIPTLSDALSCLSCALEAVPQPNFAQRGEGKHSIAKAALDNAMPCDAVANTKRRRDSRCPCHALPRLTSLCRCIATPRHASAERYAAALYPCCAVPSFSLALALLRSANAYQCIAIPLLCRTKQCQAHALPCQAMPNLRADAPNMA